MKIYNVSTFNTFTIYVLPVSFIKTEREMHSSREIKRERVWKRYSNLSLNHAYDDLPVNFDFSTLSWI